MKIAHQGGVGWDVHIAWFMGILFLACLLRLPYQSESIWPDEALYSWCGKRILESPRLVLSKEVTEYQPPLFAAMTAICHLILPADIAPRAVPALWGILGVVLIYWLGAALRNRFTGLLAATLLTFNPLHHMLSHRILTDVPLVALITLLIYCSHKYNGARKISWGAVLGLVAGSAVWMKWSGALGILLMGVSLWIPRIQERRPFGLKLSLLPLSISLILALPLPLNNYLRFGKLLPDFPALRGQFYTTPLWAYLAGIRSFLSWPVLAFVAVGLISALRSRRKETWLLLSWFFLFLIATSSVGEKDPRYLLPALPALFLLSALGVDWLVTFVPGERLKSIAQSAILACVLLLSVNPYFLGIRLIDSAAERHIGYKEAGMWLSEHAGPDALIYAGSPRAIRLFSDLNYEEFGGPLRRLPHNRAQFERTVKGEKRLIFLEVDVWDFGQPKWVYPPDPGRVKWLMDLGFEPRFARRVRCRAQGRIVDLVAVIVFERVSN